MHAPTDWLALAWAQTWQLTLLIVAVAILVRIAAANRPHLAFILWMIIFVKCLTPPLWSSPSGAFCWLQQTSSQTSTSSLAPDDTTFNPTIAASQRLPSPRFKPSNTSKPIASLPSSNNLPPPLPCPANNRANQRQLVIGKLASGVWADPSPPKPIPEPPKSDSLTPCRPIDPLVSVWLAGAIALLGLMAWRSIRFARLLRRAAPIHDDLCQSIFESLRDRLRIRRPVRLIVTERPLGPAVVGPIRPTVVLPHAVIEGKSSEQIELILAHELAHVRRGDLWFGLLRSAAVAIWWFHPLLWWASRRASREAERCCDEAVVAELRCRPASYARCLLDVLETKRQVRCVPACPGVGAIEITQGRLERIMQIGERAHRRTAWWHWGIAVLVTAVALPGAAIGISHETPAKKADSGSDAPKTYKQDDRDAEAAKKEATLIKPPSRSHGAPQPAKKAATDQPRDAWRDAPPLPRRLSEPTLAPPRDAVFPRPAQDFQRDAPALRRATRSRYESVPNDYTNAVRGRYGSDEPVFRDGVQDYLVSDVLQLIATERNLDARQSVEFLKNLLKSQVQQSSPSEIGVPRNAVVTAIATSASRPAAQIPIDIVWRGSESIEAETTAEGHRRITKALQTVRRCGLGEIRIAVYFLTGPADEIKRAKLNWTILPIELATAVGSHDSPQKLPIEAFFDDHPRANRAQYISTKSPPMIYDILADDFAAKIRDQFQSNKAANVLQAPQVTFFNGQSGFVSDCAWSQFVVALKDGKPQTRLVPEGTIVGFRPLAEKRDDGLRIDFQAMFAKIGAVETVQLSDIYEGKPITIQIPEVSATLVEGNVELPWNRWLLLGSVEAINGGPKPITLVMLRAEKIEPFHLPSNAQPPNVIPGPVAVPTFAPDATLKP